jgi:hypothetical protein
MSIKWDVTKDPQDKKDYSLDWSLRLEPDSDTIVSSTWTIVTGSGLVIDSDSFADDSTTVWLSGGTNNIKYTLLNHVVTNSTPPREYDQTVQLTVKSH